MLDFWDMLHYLVGFFILAIILWVLGKINNYLSKDNIPIMPNKQS